MSAWVRFSAAEHRIGLEGTTPYEESRLLAAVIEAVEARSAQWGVGVNDDAPQDLGRNSATVSLGGGFWTDGYGSTPAAALLTAYLAALEADHFESNRAAIAEQEHGWRNR